MNNLNNFKLNYFKEIDKHAKYVAKKLYERKLITKQILKFIIELYDSEKSTAIFEKTENYTLSGHQPVTSDFEFFISRVIYHYSTQKKLGWEIRLRPSIQDKQTGKQVQPDVLIRKDGKILAIIEIKIKAGYIQCFFSKIREKEDIKKKYKTKELIDNLRSQFEKYSKLEKCGKNKVFVLLPTFALVSRKRNNEKIEDYKKQFEKNSKLNKDNLIILSNNKDLDLSRPQGELNPTNEFEKFINTISKW